MFNHKYGFGVLDAYRIVELANKFRSVGPQTYLEVSLGNIEPFEIPDITTNNKGRQHALKSAIQVTEEMVLSASLSLLEHVTVTVHIEHQRRGDLEILLVSPNNVTSQLGTPRKNDNSKDGLVNWTFMSVKHWEEQPVGNWTLWIIDERNPEFKGKLIHWKLTLWGENKNGAAVALVNNYQTSIQSFLLRGSISKQRSLLTYVLISVCMIISMTGIFVFSRKLRSKKINRNKHKPKNDSTFELDTLLHPSIDVNDEYEQE